MVKAAKPEVLVPADAADMADQFRSFTDGALEQSREIYAKAKTSVEEAQKSIEATMGKVQAANTEFGLTAIAAIRKATDSNLSHLEKLMGVKSFSNFVELQTAFFREQAEMAVEQSKVLQDAAQKAAGEVVEPVKAAYEKAVKDIKIA